jgi:hypothetical protein
VDVPGRRSDGCARPAQAHVAVVPPRLAGQPPFAGAAAYLVTM